MPVLKKQLPLAIFLDETHFVSDDLYKKRGWFRDEDIPFSYQQGIFMKESCSLLLAISYSGVICRFVHKHTESSGVKDTIFLQFLEMIHHSVPMNMKIVMDNARAHTSKTLKLKIAGMFDDGRSIVCQAKYSPDLNPIELIFGTLKKRAKSDVQHPKDLIDAVYRLVAALDADCCRKTINKIFKEIPDLAV